MAVVFESLLTIGQLSRRCGVPVRTIRFWSDAGVLPETDRSTGGYRRYDAAAVARLDLVRALRELGMGLEDVRGVLDRRRSVAEVAAAHVPAIDAQIRALRVQRAICTLLARTPNPTDQEVTLMNDLTRLSAGQRQQLLDDFVAETFAGTGAHEPGTRIAEGMRTLPTELPDDPSTPQVAAWVELAELVSDPAFRGRVREMAVAGAAPATADADDAADEPGFEVEAVFTHAEPARAEGVDPASAEGQAVLARIVGPDLPAARRSAMADRIDTFGDRRVERYWTLLGVLNDWPPRPPSVSTFEWFAAALRAGT